MSERIITKIVIYTERSGFKMEFEKTDEEFNEIMKILSIKEKGRDFFYEKIEVKDIASDSVELLFQSNMATETE